MAQCVWRALSPRAGDPAIAEAHDARLAVTWPFDLREQRVAAHPIANDLREVVLGIGEHHRRVGELGLVERTFGLAERLGGEDEQTVAGLDPRGLTPRRLPASGCAR